MELAIPRFQYRFMAAAGNVIFPANFHPVGSQVAARAMVERAAKGASAKSGDGGLWMVVGGSGGFGSAARAVLGCQRGAHTLNLSFDAPPQPDSKNKIRKIGSPAYHRNLAIEAQLRERGLLAHTLNADAFDPKSREAVIEALAKQFKGQKIKGLVWSLAAPRGLDPRSGEVIASSLKPLGQSTIVKTMGSPEEEGDAPVRTMELAPGSPEEAVATQYVMGGGIVNTWIQALAQADALAEGFTLLTVSYRGNPLNANIYRNGLIGLAKADLEAHTRALSKMLEARVGGRAFALECPAVVTEASGGIPGVPLYMALISDVMGERFEDPLDNMYRLFTERLVDGQEVQVDDEGLIRMDDRELEQSVQAEMQKRYDAFDAGGAVPRELFERFIKSYAQTRGFEVPGVDYEAAFDTEKVCSV